MQATQLDNINRKLTVFKQPTIVAFGLTKTGILTEQVNPDPKNDVLTCFSQIVGTTSKYILNQYSLDYNIGTIPYITQAAAVKYELFAVATTATRTVTITGVDQSGNEVSENVIIPIAPTTIQTVNFYRCVNNMILFGGGLLSLLGTEILHCRPAGGNPHDIRVSMTSVLKINPLIMVGAKNGQSRRARLRCINDIDGFSADHYTIHVFNGQTTGTNIGIFNPTLKMYGVTVAKGTEFADGAVDIGPGEMAAVYRESTSGATARSFVSCTWEFYNA